VRLYVRAGSLHRAEIEDLFGVIFTAAAQELHAKRVRVMGG
jgi:hypothetical protein